MKTLKLLTLLSCALMALSCSRGIPAERVASALNGSAPGDTIVISPGTYSDVDLHWRGCGTAESPVVVMASEPGSVIISGQSALHISGEGLEVRDLLFKDAFTKSDAIVEFRDGDSLARRCRFANCVMDGCNPSRRDSRYSYIQLFGRHNRVDHCSLLGRRNLGVTLVVRLTSSGCDENYHEIDHNYFGPRPVYGSNGAESIQIGLAQQCMQACRTHLHHNLFDRCNGEVECVSIKSSDNIIEDNVLYECQGVMALRHGDRNIARNNLFIGNGIINTGGIRVVGEDQVLEGNSFYGCRGHRFYAPLALMCGVPNCLPNRYIQVKNTIIRNNMWSDCSDLEFDTGLDLERTLLPVGTVFQGNTICSGAVAPSYESVRDGMGADWYTEAEPDVKEDVIMLKDSTYVITEAIRISAPTLICAEPGAHPVISFQGRKADNMVTICDGGSLTVRGVTFNNKKMPGKTPARHGIATAKDMLQPYRLICEDCTFEYFETIGQYPICGFKGTFADSVVCRRCNFSAVASDAISFAGESDNKGIYNCDDVVLEDCTFSRVAEVAVNIYRGGSDESTAGPRMVMRGCTFDDCSNKVRSCAVRAFGVQDLLIENCNFVHSGRGGFSIRLDDAPWEKIVLRENRYSESGGVQSSRGILAR